jgi:hypothetical protein
MLRALKFLNLLDSEGNLSITNIAVIVGITKMALTANFSGMDAVGLVGALLNYGHKRSCNNQVTDEN